MWEVRVKVKEFREMVTLLGGRGNGLDCSIEIIRVRRKREE